MLKAKAAYAEGRKLVDEAFVDFLDQTVDFIRSADDLRLAKLFLEAFLGFYNKRGLRQLIKRICTGKVGRLVLTHKDRLLRFGSEKAHDRRL